MWKISLAAEKRKKDRKKERKKVGYIRASVADP
jgi:hypothetical protein